MANFSQRMVSYINNPKLKLLVPHLWKDRACTPQPLTQLYRHAHIQHRSTTIMGVFKSCLTLITIPIMAILVAILAQHKGWLPGAPLADPSVKLGSGK